VPRLATELRYSGQAHPREALKMLHGLRQWMPFRRGGQVRKFSCSKEAETNFASLIPKFPSEVGCLKSCQEQNEEDHNFSLPWTPIFPCNQNNKPPLMTERTHAAREADMLEEFCGNPFDGGWQLKDRNQRAHTKDDLKFFMITRGTLTTASLTTYTVQSGDDPDKIRFSDVRGQLLSDDTLEISVANGPNVLYSRVDLPTASTVSALQGTWVRRYKGRDWEEDTLRVQGACVEVVEAGKASCALLRAYKDKKITKLQKKVVHVSAEGSLFLQTQSGPLQHYRRPSTQSNLEFLRRIPEEPDYNSY